MKRASVFIFSSCLTLLLGYLLCILGSLCRRKPVISFASGVLFILSGNAPLTRPRPLYLLTTPTFTYNLRPIILKNHAHSYAPPSSCLLTTPTSIHSPSLLLLIRFVPSYLKNHAYSHAPPSLCLLTTPTPFTRPTYYYIWDKVFYKLRLFCF